MNSSLIIYFGDFQWVEVIYAMVGSFVGIFIPLWIDKNRAKRQEKEARGKLLASLDRELESVKALIEEYNSPKHQYDIFSFSTFVWDSIISAGMLTDMLADSDIKGELIVEIYSELSMLKELHDEFCQRPQRGGDDMVDDLATIYESIMKARTEIYEKIVSYQVANKPEER